jgi:outer membrane protein
MNNYKKIAFGVAAITTSFLSAITVANAADRTVSGKSWDAKERFMIRARAIGVIPDESSSTSIGGEVTVDDRVVPELDFSYFFTDHIAAELIAAVTKHDIGAVNTSLGDLDLGSVWLLPPTLTLQYHFNPYGDIRPYAGAGLSYVHYFNVDKAGFNSIDYDDGFGYALQAGVDIAVSDHWAINADVKKIFHQVDASINGGAVTADVNCDPWIVGVGIAYRF